MRLSRVAALVRKLIGVPDYDRYLVHMHERYPGCTPIDRETFEKDRLAARYRTAGNRCC
ncbi:MAG: YbdD/YjiX family protein [Gemmatimonadaceae bacterium]|nr:YbdD/YjiX family protein [Gemmatimonadaceae bacterium]